MSLRHIIIRSNMAALANRCEPGAYPEEEWEGDVTIADGGIPVLDVIFRLFNRVDMADSVRLEEWDYRLPSLSVGDRVTIDGQRWRCAAVGWDLEEDHDIDSMDLDEGDGEGSG